MMMMMLFLPEEEGVRVQGLGQVCMLKRTHTSTGIRSSGDEIIHELSVSDFRSIAQISIIFYHFHGNLVTHKSDGQIELTSSRSKGGIFGVIGDTSGGHVAMQFTLLHFGKAQSCCTRIGFWHVGLN